MVTATSGDAAVMQRGIVRILKLIFFQVAKIKLDFCNLWERCRSNLFKMALNGARVYEPPSKLWYYVADN